jgi:hypothetical protein
MKRLAALCVVAVCYTPTAHADVGGSIPAPGLCDYPGVGASGQVMNEYHYWCDFPTEINGSHWHAELAGFSVQAAVSAGLTIGFMSLSASLMGQVGGIVGSTSWRCPDNTLAEPPNPPGAWKNKIWPTKCKTIGPNPDDPPPEAPPPAPPSGLTPAVTDPAQGNPVATQNDGR